MATQTSGKDEWLQLVEEGMVAGKNRDVRKSATLFKQAYELSRNFAKTDARRGDSAFYLGTALIVLGEQGWFELYEEAQKFLWESADTADRISKICTALASADIKENRFEKAESRLRDALNLEKKYKLPSEETEEFLKITLIQQEKWHDVLPMLESILERHRSAHAQKAIIETLRILAFVNNKIGDLAAEMKWQKELLKLRGLKTDGPPKLPKVQVGEPPPSGWGNDSLSNYIAGAQQNEWANFVRYNELFKELAILNDRFLKTRENLAIPMARGLSDQEDKTFAQIAVGNDQWLEPYLFMQCHSGFLSAARSALASSISQAKRDLRGCLENALFALFMQNDPSRKQIWLEASKDKQSDSKARNEFKFGVMLAHLQNLDASLGQVITDLYVATINEGAHPGVHSHVQSAFQANANGMINLGVLYLDPGSAEEQMQQTQKVGEAVLKVFELIFPHLVE